MLLIWLSRFSVPRKCSWTLIWLPSSPTRHRFHEQQFFPVFEQVRIGFTHRLFHLPCVMRTMNPFSILHQNLPLRNARETAVWNRTVDRTGFRPKREMIFTRIPAAGGFYSTRAASGFRGPRPRSPARGTVLPSTRRALRSLLSRMPRLVHGEPLAGLHVVTPVGRWEAAARKPKKDLRRRQGTLTPAFVVRAGRCPGRATREARREIPETAIRASCRAHAKLPGVQEAANQSGSVKPGEPY